jgi:rhamnogalacturonan endolyase
MFANGNHNLSVADVDGDGKDEIIWGSAAVDDDGKLLYATGFGHGDAIHLGDLNPDRPGLELFDIHEEKANMLGTYMMLLREKSYGKVGKKEPIMVVD